MAKKPKKRKKKAKKKEVQISTKLASSSKTAKKVPKEKKPKKSPKINIDNFEPHKLSIEFQDSSKDLAEILLEEETLENTEQVLVEERIDKPESDVFENPYQPKNQKDFYSSQNQNTFYTPKEAKEIVDGREDYFIKIRIKDADEHARDFYTGVLPMDRKKIQEREYTEFVTGILESDEQTDVLDEAISSTKKFYSSDESD